mmetsp:Transcript_104707/g.249317  ORF Transcript_104707/g.249317 Transcript_104707/m.249317 type:complete len:244 (+) Transcript_104707:22-753(+)
MPSSAKLRQGARRPAAVLLALACGAWTFAQVAERPVPPQPESPEPEAESQRLAAKEALLESLKSLDRGFAATEAERSRVSEQIDELVQWNPTTAPARLGGNWTLLYTDAPDILNIPTSPLASLGRIGQEINAEKGVIANVIEYRPSPLAVGLKASALEDTLVQRVFTEYKVTSGSKVELNIKGLGLDPQRVLGYDLPEALKLTLQGPLTLPFGNFEILYLDDEIRIVRTGQGWYSVNRRGAFG